MKAIVLSTAATSAALSLMVIAAPARGDALAHWTFNSTFDDHAPTTGTLIPESGAGTITAAGGTSFSYAQGSGGDTSPTVFLNNNSSLEVKGFPSRNDDNKTAGIQIAIDTTGYEDIILSYQHRHSEGASSTFRIQYSSDGVTFTDGDAYTTNIANVFHARQQDFSDIAALDDNPSVVFRILAEFEGQQYFGTSGDYVPNADSRFDLVTISGTPVPEPARLALLALAGPVLAWRRRCRERGRTGPIDNNR